MSLRRRWRTLFARTRKPAARPGLALEALESRDVPAISLVSGFEGSLSTSGNGYSQLFGPGSMSDDGRYVVFTSTATDLVSGQVDSQAAITAASWEGVFFFGFLIGGTATFTTATPHGLAFNDVVNVTGVNPSGYNGQFLVDSVVNANTFKVTLGTDPGTYVSGGGLGTFDVFLRDTVDNTTTLISRSATSPTTTGNGESIVPVISGDGNWVAFYSKATDLVSGANVSGYQVYLYERATGEMTLVSHTAGDTTTGASMGNTQYEYGQLALSDDGRYATFISYAWNLVPGQQETSNEFSIENPSPDAFIYDRLATSGQRTSLVSHTPTSSVTEGNDPTTLVTISGDGSTVAFVSYARNLGQSESGSFSSSPDVFLYNVATGEIKLVTHAPNDSTFSAASQSDRDLWVPSISYDGTRVVYQSVSAELVAGQQDTSGTFQDTVDVFLYDATTGTNYLVSRKFGTTATSDSPAVLTGLSGSPAVISSDGKWVAFASNADELLSSQISNPLSIDNVYLFDVERALNEENGVIVLVSHTSASQTAPTGGAFPSISNDGSYVVFTGINDDATRPAIVKYARSDGSVTTVGILSDSSSSTANTALGVISGDGTTVVFNSVSATLVTNDNNGTQDVFIAGSDTGTPPGNPTGFTLVGQPSLVPNLPGEVIGQFQVDADPANRQFVIEFVDNANFPDNLQFQLVDLGGGVIQLQTGPNFDGQFQLNPPIIKLRAEDQFGFIEQQFQLQFQVVNPPAIPDLLKLDQGQFQVLVPGAPNVPFAQFQIDNPQNRPLQFVLEPGVQDNDQFQIVVDNGVVQLQTGPNFPPAGQTQFVVEVKVYDDDFQGLYTIQQFTLDLVVAPAQLQLNVGQAVPALANEAFAQFVVDGAAPGANLQFQIVGGADAAQFQVVEDGGVWKLVTAATFPVSGQTQYTVQVKVFDAEFPSLSYTETLQLTLATAPTAVTLNVGNVVPALANQAFAQLQADGAAPGADLQFQIVGGADAAQFQIVEENGVWKLVTKATFPVSGQTQYTVVVRAEDATFPSLFHDQTLTLTLVSAPATVGLSKSTVTASPNQPVGLVSVPASNRTYTFTLVNGFGDNARFALSGNQLLSGAAFPDGNRTSYSVKVRATDAQFPDLFTEQVFTITAQFPPPATAVPKFTVAPLATGLEGAPIPLSISAAPGDAFSTVTITIAGLPAGAVLSAGANLGNGTWVLIPSQLPGLLVTMPDDGTYNLLVTATATGPGGPSSVGTFVQVVVSNVAPSATVATTTTTFDPTVSPVVTITVSVTDPGQDTVQFVTVDWGDGTVETFVGNPGQMSHAYAVLDRAYAITVTVTDEDGTFAALNGVFVDAELPTPESTVVAELYQDLLGRNADADGLANWAGQLASGAAIEDVVRAIMASPEYKQRVVNELYLKYLGREADPSGLADGVQFLLNGGTTRELAARLLASPEFYERFGGGTDSGYLAALYQAILGREIDPSGLRTFSALLSFAGPKAVVDELLASEEARRIEAERLYKTYLGREADAEGLAGWTSALATLSTDDVILSFLTSEEFGAQFAAK